MMTTTYANKRIEELELLVADTEVKRRVLAYELEIQAAALRVARISARAWQAAYHKTLDLAYPPFPLPGAPVVYPLSVAVPTQPDAHTSAGSGPDSSACSGDGAPDAAGDSHRVTIGQPLDFGARTDL